MLQKKIILDSETKIYIIDIERITHIHVDSISSEIYTEYGIEYHSNKTLTFFESSLPESFFRINRNTIVNLSHVENIDKLSRRIKIKHDINLFISTRRLKCLTNHLKRISVR